MESVQVTYNKSIAEKSISKQFISELKRDKSLYIIWEASTSLFFAEVFQRYVANYGYPKSTRDIYVITNAASKYHLDVIINRVEKEDKTLLIDTYLEAEILKSPKVEKSTLDKCKEKLSYCRGLITRSINTLYVSINQYKTKHLFMLFLLMSCLLGFKDGLRNQCYYSSILDKYNIIYRASCELLEPRFTKTQQTVE